MKLNNNLKMSLLYLCSCWFFVFSSGMLWLNEANATQGCLTQFPCMALPGQFKMAVPGNLTCMALPGNSKEGRAATNAKCNPASAYFVCICICICAPCICNQCQVQSALQFPPSAIEAGLYRRSMQRTIM